MSLKKCLSLLLAAVFLLAAAPTYAQDQITHSIMVSGSADVRVIPDQVVLTVGVETWDESILQAKADNDSRTQNVLALAEPFGIEPQYVKADYITVEPRYDNYNTNNPGVIVGYFVRKTIVMTLKDTARFEELLTEVLNAGANYIYDAEFQTTELRKHRDEARSLALKAAREKGEAMAAELGETIGRPITIQENTGGWFSSYRWGGSGFSNVSQNVIQESGGAAPEIEGAFAPGQIVVSASVTVTFELAG